MEGRQSTGIDTDKKKCAHCREMYPFRYIMSHEVLCKANPANQYFLGLQAIPELRQFIPNLRERLRERHDPAPVLIEDEGSNLITSSPDPVKEALSFTAELLVLDDSFTQGPQQYLCTVQEAKFTVVVSSMNRKDSSLTLKAGDMGIAVFVVCEPAVAGHGTHYHTWQI
ncbi:unnamed protein product [Cuscuta campestris]|uniref:Uncharacterized protein n=1 Tax=Cuscuta campestris TaxID=132261 RepID=A0A484L9M9_9ASTE|nr:unnamed protein product [Cuscuta campestris]